MTCVILPVLFALLSAGRTGKPDLENYFMYVIGDYRTAASACAWYWQPHAQVFGTGSGLNNTVPWGRYCATFLAQGLTCPFMQGTLCDHAALLALFLWRNWKGSSTRPPEVARNLSNFQFLAFFRLVKASSYTR